MRYNYRTVRAMMMNVNHLLAIADAYKAAAGVSADTTVSSRVFGDSKKLTSLRSGSDITVGRYNHAIMWFEANWPVGVLPPSLLLLTTAPAETPACDDDTVNDRFAQPQVAAE